MQSFSPRHAVPPVGADLAGSTWCSQRCFRPTRQRFLSSAARCRLGVAASLHGRLPCWHSSCNASIPRVSRLLLLAIGASPARAWTLLWMQCRAVSAAHHPPLASAFLPAFTATLSGAISSRQAFFSHPCLLCILYLSSSENCLLSALCTHRLPDPSPGALLTMTPTLHFHFRCACLLLLSAYAPFPSCMPPPILTTPPSHPF